MITLRLLLSRRGLIQRCAAAKVINLISLGGQHQGVFGVPECSTKRLICRFYRFVLNLFAYTNWAQKHIAQATYWHDPFNEGKYREKSSFLADINNEKDINENYRKRLQSLNQFVMVKFLRDKIVQPIESSWFGFYKPESDTTVLSLSDSQTYIRDNLGLKRMMKDGKLVFLEVWKLCDSFEYQNVIYFHNNNSGGRRARFICWRMVRWGNNSVLETVERWSSLAWWLQLMFYLSTPSKLVLIFE